MGCCGDGGGGSGDGGGGCGDGGGGDAGGSLGGGVGGASGGGAGVICFLSGHLYTGCAARHRNAPPVCCEYTHGAQPATHPADAFLATGSM